MPDRYPADPGAFVLIQHNGLDVELTLMRAGRRQARSRAGEHGHLAQPPRPRRTDAGASTGSTGDRSRTITRPSAIPTWFGRSAHRPRKTIGLHAGDEAVHPLVVGAERILAQDGALGLVVEFQVHPVDGEVAPAFLGVSDELPAQPGPGGLRRG